MTRNYLEVAAEIGIIAAPTTLLLVAGEFDLSVGSTVAASEAIIGYLTVHSGWPFAAALAAALAVAVVDRRRQRPARREDEVALLHHHSRDAVHRARRRARRPAHADRAPARSTAFARRSASGPLAALFSGSVGPFSISLVWWIVCTLLAAWVLDKTAFGNWIFATGGNQAAAVRTGIPVNRVKIVLYIAVAASTTLVAALDVFAINQANANAAVGREFEVVTAAVIGGALADRRLRLADRHAVRRAAVRHGGPRLLLHAAAGRMVHDASSA